VIAASDGHPDYPAKVGENMAIALGGTDKARLTRIFNDLAEGGSIQGPVAKPPWGGSAEEGWLRDKFGISWTVSIDKGVAWLPVPLAATASYPFLRMPLMPRQHSPDRIAS